MSLTGDEHGFIRRAGDLFGDFVEIVGDGDTRDTDIAEALLHIHALQNMVLAQAAAREYPDDFRLLGENK